MKYLATFLTIVAVALAGLASAQERGAPGGMTSPSWRYVSANEYRQAAVRVACDGRILGSGVIVRWGDQRPVVTALHVVKGASKIIVRTCTGRTYNAKLISYDMLWDLASLNIGNPANEPFAEFPGTDRVSLQIGERVETTGFGPDDKMAASTGTVVQFVVPRPTVTHTDWATITGYARGGDSGGPAFNQDGKLVGILWGARNQAARINVVQGGRVYNFLAETFTTTAAQQKSTGPRAELLSEPAENMFTANLVEQLQVATFPARPNPSRPTRPMPPVEDDVVQQPPCGPGGCPVSPEFGQDHPILDKLLPGRKPTVQPAPPVVVNPDPNVGKALTGISGKLDILIQEKQKPEPKVEEKPDTMSPVLAGLVVLVVVVIGFAVYFGTMNKQS